VIVLATELQCASQARRAQFAKQSQKQPVFVLLGLFRSLTLAETGPQATAVFVDKLDARLFKGTSDFLCCFRTTRDRPIN
jgi:hypothetical protein